MVDEHRVVGPGFHEQVYGVVRGVPSGAVTTYGDVGTLLGSPRVARHVGWALAALDPTLHGPVPWHRVINSRGRISYRGDSERGMLQQRLLESEGIEFIDTGRVRDFKDVRWRP